MLQITQDPSDPSRLILTATVTLYLEKLTVAVLSDEIKEAVRKQAIHDLKSSPAVRKAISKATTAHLLALLGVSSSPEPVGESSGS